MGKIYYIMGKSSSGKDSVFKEIQKRMPELSQITMYTTRPIREGERDGGNILRSMTDRFLWTKKIIL